MRRREGEVRGIEEGRGGEKEGGREVRREREGKGKRREERKGT